jgi:peptidoglycan/LPS O-acetylase OafA/YrhL
MPSEHNQNNFGALRLIAAWLVLVGHSFELLARTHFGVFGDPFGVLTRTDTLGAAGVIIFFSLSGYLVTQSLLRCETIGEFIWRRALRIIPALWVMLVVSTVIWAPLMSTLAAAHYFAHPVAQDYLMGMFFLFHSHLPGTFQSNPLSSGFNGVLWTLPIEARCYLLLAIAGVFDRRFFKVAIAIGIAGLALAAARTIYKTPFFFPGFQQPSPTVVKLALPFFLGAAVALWKLERFMRLAPALVVLSIVVGMGIFWLPAQKFMWLIFALATSYATLAFGLQTKGWLSIVTRRGDFSYGVYLWAFPIQQSLIHYFPNIGVTVLIATTTALALNVGWLSWKWVEAPMLLEKDLYRLWLAKMRSRLSQTKTI